jgi:hypothetical protein
MKVKLVTAFAAAAIAVAPFAPAHAADSNICAVFAEPYSTVCWIVVGPLCQEPWPPLSICN